MKNVVKMLGLSVVTGAFLCAASINAEETNAQPEKASIENPMNAEAGELNLNDSSSDKWWGYGGWGYGLGYGLGYYGLGWGGYGYGLGCCGYGGWGGWGYGWY